MAIPWCVGGDFNKVLFFQEQNKASRRLRGMDVFGDFVDRNELVNVTLRGTRFTWSNFQANPSLSKLDRFLVSTSWDNLFSPVISDALPRPSSNHTPILLKGGEVVR